MQPRRTTGLLAIITILLELFLAVTAIIGAVYSIPLLPVEWLAGTPFTSFLIPALALGILVGGSAALAVVLLATRRRWRPLVALLSGAAIAVFETVQVLTLSLGVWLNTIASWAGQPPPVPAASLLMGGEFHPALWLQPFYFALGLVIAALAARLWRASDRRAPAAPAAVQLPVRVEPQPPPAAGTPRARQAGA